MIFPKNIGQRLSIDEVAVTNGELYTVIINKAAHCLGSWESHGYSESGRDNAARLGGD